MDNEPEEEIKEEERSTASAVDEGVAVTAALSGGATLSADAQVREEEKKPKKYAEHLPTYHDLREDLVLVNRHLLKDIAKMSLLQEGAGAAGMFFVSGAFWLFITLLAEHHDALIPFIPWLLMCLLSIGFGIVLLWVAWINWRSNDEKIEDIFKNLDDEDASKR